MGIITLLIISGILETQSCFVIFEEEWCNFMKRISWFLPYSFQQDTGYGYDGAHNFHFVKCVKLSTFVLMGMEMEL